MNSSLAQFILVGSLFYYIGKGLLPTVVTGKNIYPVILGVAGLAFIIKIVARGRLISRSMNLAVLLFGIGSFGLYLALTLLDDSRRFETSFTQYFGIFPFILLFYALFSFSQLDVLGTVKIFIPILSLEALAEYILVNFFGLSRYMVHYDSTELWARYHAVEQGLTSNRVIGLLGNTSNTSVFMVALLYLYLALRPPGNLKKDPLVYLFIPGFLACFSGMGFAALILSAVFYSLSNFLWMTLIVTPLILGAGHLIGTIYEYAYKLSFTYISFIFYQKTQYLQNFIGQISEYPLLLLFGAPTKFHWSVGDMAALKIIYDFGVAPVLLYFYLIWALLKNINKMNMPMRSRRFFRLSMLSLVIGTLHYPVLFSFPVQALLAALVAYSMSVRKEKTFGLNSVFEKPNMGLPLAGQ